ncbi:hypothetical protein FRUB_01031 [Fimbriiglobus ruber]|uniref:Uncharacterized protein n=1 Tax=Fimbriiglobus ruber TaxID=1908690 RepID=A0A225E168_9BACT|nr:hypothetical protein FRUB_01031 [Fimbriiglobus ruber]
MLKIPVKLEKTGPHDEAGRESLTAIARSYLLAMAVGFYFLNNPKKIRPTPADVFGCLTAFDTSEPTPNTITSSANVMVNMAHLSSRLGCVLPTHPSMPIRVVNFFDFVSESPVTIFRVIYA